MTRIATLFERLLLPALLVLGLAGCATGYPGGYGDGYGAPGAYPDRGYGEQRLLGTVQHVDPSAGRLVLSADDRRGGARDIEVWFDQGTRLYYQGREHPVAGLERGDRVDVQIADDGRRLWARSIEVVQNVRDSAGGSYYGGGLEGAVRHVDTRRRVIEISRGGYSGRVEAVHYDDRTRFDHRGQYLRPEQIEAGDIVRIQARPAGQAWHADMVTVIQDARSR
jgi:hypothetical protein